MITAGARVEWRDVEARLRPFVARRVRRAADVDDVVQEVLLRAHRGLPGLVDARTFGAWVYRIARRAIADHRRRAAREEVAEGDLSSVSGGEEDEPRAERELAACLHGFVEELPSAYREAVVLSDLGGLTQRDAASRAGVSLE